MDLFEGNPILKPIEHHSWESRYVFNPARVATFDLSEIINSKRIHWRRKPPQNVYSIRDIGRERSGLPTTTPPLWTSSPGRGFWVMEGKCDSENCRGKLDGDFSKLPKPAEEIPIRSSRLG